MNADQGATAAQGATTAPDPRGTTGLRERILTIVWWAGTVLLGLIAVSALVVTASVLHTLVGHGLDPSDLIWMAIAAAAVAAGLGALAIVVLVARRGHTAVAVSIGLVAIVATRAIAIVTIPTPLQTDWAEYHHDAIILATGGAFESARPPGWPFVLSLLYRAGGPDPLLGELANLACALAVGLLVYALARRTFGGVAAAAGLFLWAISPGPAMFVVALASEHLHAFVFLAAVALAVLALGRRWVAWVPVGILLALSQYVRPVGLVIVPAFLVLPFLVGVPRRQAGTAAITVLVAFALVLGPAVAWQYQRYGRLTMSTSNFDGWNLLVGLNVAHGGRYNRDDLALVGAAPETVEFRDRSYRLAIERLISHPEAVVVLAAPKFRVMWGDSTYGPSWTLAADGRSHPRVTATMTLLSQVWYTLVVVLAVVLLFIRRRERDPVVLLTILCLGAVAASAVFLEVQPRYHAFFEPLFCLLAGGTVGWLAERWSLRRQPVATPAPSVGEAPLPDPAPMRAAGGGSPTPAVRTV